MSIALESNTEHADREADYVGFLDRINARFLTLVNPQQAGGPDPQPVFTTDAEDLWGVYLDSFTGPEQRQHHNCHACRHFVERFGDLALLDAQRGAITPAVWEPSDAPALYRPGVAALARRVRSARITGVFLSPDAVWGTPITGAWHHFALTPTRVYREGITTAHQAMAEKREDFKTVVHALEQFTLVHLETALRLLKNDALYRSEKVLGQAEWLYDLQLARTAARGNAKANVVWRAIAGAPAGYCHPRASMIGSLLEDIAAGKDYAAVARAFADKMHPLQYRRPQAAPTAGAIAAAEKLVQQLGAGGALARRFARVDEIQALWRPAPDPAKPAAGGVFGHLKPKGAVARVMALPAQTLTWDKFLRTVLPTAERIELKAPAGKANYCALVTAVHPDAPPILQWDREDARNPVSWYLWTDGSTAAQFNLKSGAWHPVDAITLKPSMWNGGHEHQGAGIIFVIAGARETRAAGAALFPENLRAEFHGARAVIEAYSRTAVIEGMDQPHAAGLMLDKGESWCTALRVWSGSHSQDYRLDRWD